jgi:DNA-binding HxlR family transcriptional regulator
VTGGRPVRIEYTLTDAGADLDEAIEALAGWAERWAMAVQRSAQEPSETSTAGDRPVRSSAGGRSR